MLSIIQLTKDIEQRNISSTHSNALHDYYMSPRKLLIDHSFTRRPTQKRKKTRFRRRSKPPKTIRQRKAAVINLGSSTTTTIPSRWVDTVVEQNNTTPKQTEQPTHTHTIPTPVTLTDGGKDMENHNRSNDQDHGHDDTAPAPLMRLIYIPTLSGSLLVPRMGPMDSTAAPAAPVASSSSSPASPPTTIRLNTTTIDYDGVEHHKPVAPPPPKLSPRCRPKSAKVRSPRVLVQPALSTMPTTTSITKATLEQMRVPMHTTNKRKTANRTRPTSAPMRRRATRAMATVPFLVIGGQHPPVQHETPTVSPRVQPHVSYYAVAQNPCRQQRHQIPRRRVGKKPRRSVMVVLRSPRPWRKDNICAPSRVRMARTASRPSTDSRRPRSASMAGTKRGGERGGRGGRDESSRASCFVRLMM